jgi:serine/threonine protein phosphatase PrpC
VSATALDLGIGAATDVGLRRSANEDSYIVAHPVFAVADGMGGHEAGDLASQAVVAQLARMSGHSELRPGDVAAVIASAHESVRVIADGRPRGAGSTLTGVVVIEQDGRPHWLVFNIGDSRVYRMIAGELTQWTADHSIVQQLVRGGDLAPEDASTFAGRNVITKAVGADDSDPDFWLYPVVDGELLVICSDGLTGEVTDAEISELANIPYEPQQLADRLVERALAAGGRDNVTVIVLRVRSGGLDPELDTGVLLDPELNEDTEAVDKHDEHDDLDESTIELSR